jgi:capsular polysaccharide biosynthesis protein
MENVASRSLDEGTGIISSIWRFRWIVVVAALVGATAGYFWSARQPAQYLSSARLVLSLQANNDILGRQAQPVNDPDRYMRNQAQLANSRVVLIRAAELTGLDNVSAGDLAPLIQVVPSPDADVITVSALTESGQTSATIANAVARAYQIVAAQRAEATITRLIDEIGVNQRDLRASLRGLESRTASGAADPVSAAERDAISQELSVLAERVADLRLARLLAADGQVQLMEPGGVPAHPVAPQPRRTAAVGALVALLAASGLAWGLAARYPVTAKAGEPKRAQPAERLPTSEARHEEPRVNA